MNNTLERKIFSLSPHLEMIGRRIYWYGVVPVLGAVFNRKRSKASRRNFPKIDFSAIINFLTSNGVSKGNLIIVHSAYGPLRGTGMSPSQIVECLLSLVGEEGTLAMPAMPSYKNDPPVNHYLCEKMHDDFFEYDVNLSPIKTGLLPDALHQKKGSIRSRYPINSMVAVGRLAEYLMKDNLVDENSLPCGYHSSWYRCVQEDGVIVGLGTDLTHSLTMIHVAEDILEEKWPIQNWYRRKRFLITEGSFKKEVSLRERRPRWGALHFGERTLCRELIRFGLMKSTIIDGVIVEILRARALIDFLNAKNGRGYPYFWC